MQGVLYVAATNRLYVASAATGAVYVYGVSATRIGQKPLGVVDFGEEADNLRYVEDGRVLVGFGDGEAAAAAIGTILDQAVTKGYSGRRMRQKIKPRRDTTKTWLVDAHPESFQIEQSQTASRQRRIFVNVAEQQEVQVLSCDSGETLARWQLPVPLGANYPMHLDEAQELLFLGVRKPVADACVLVLVSMVPHTTPRPPRPAQIPSRKRTFLC